MTAKRRIEIFSAGCPVCGETVAMVKRIVCSSCRVDILDMHDPAVASKARGYGIHAVPAVVINGRLATCCASSGPDEAALRAGGIGVPLP